MKYHVYSSFWLAMVIALFSALASASHRTNEKYDGTINSFRWLKNPIVVTEVLIREEQGGRIPLSRFKGKIVLLNLWASWCPPCVKELPALDRLQQRLGGNNFIVVAVSVDSEPELARKMFDDLSIESIALYRESIEAMGRHFPVDVLPATVMVDREGRAMGLLRSSLDWDNSESDTLIKRLIEGVSSDALRAEQAQRQAAQ